MCIYRNICVQQPPKSVHKWAPIFTRTSGYIACFICQTGVQTGNFRSSTGGLLACSIRYRSVYMWQGILSYSIPAKHILDFNVQKLRFKSDVRRVVTDWSLGEPMMTTHVVWHVNANFFKPSNTIIKLFFYILREILSLNLILVSETVKKIAQKRFHSAKLINKFKPGCVWAIRS